MATKNLGDIDGRLLDTTTAFAENATKAAESFETSTRLIDGNLGKLSELSGSTLTDIAAIAKRFDEHGRMLNSASELINASQSNLASTFDERQEALQNLAAGLVAKSEGIEKTMRSFRSLVSSAFDRAEGRASQTTEQIRNSISEVVEQASQKFATATDEIRRSSAAIRAELEETRSELQRGVMDMPEEAKQSTAQMRKAVSEQINALKELSEIVQKSGRLTDVGEARAARAAAPARTSAVAAQPQRSEPATAPRATTAQAPAAPAMRGSIDVRGTAAQAQRPAGNGWVSDLLRRASSDEAQSDPKAKSPETGARSPGQVVESLNSLSIDITRAIDHEASVELWQRYRAGERNVFTRRLYTLKGQQTFDEIKRKYTADSEFRRAVDRYMDDFERLLEDVSRNDRDNVMTQNYLTSDTGKVYTMLAHASNRLR